jgi:hypothetical protein
MVKRLQTMLFTSVLAGALLGLAAPSFAADDEEAKWYETFNGHEMWTMSLDDGMALAEKEGKPMLIDLFSPG